MVCLINVVSVLLGLVSIVCVWCFGSILVSVVYGWVKMFCGSLKVVSNCCVVMGLMLGVLVRCSYVVSLVGLCV